MDSWDFESYQGMEKDRGDYLDRIKPKKPAKPKSNETVVHESNCIQLNEGTNFGKYACRTGKWIVENDPSYLVWVMKNSVIPIDARTIGLLLSDIPRSIYREFKGLKLLEVIEDYKARCNAHRERMEASKKIAETFFEHRNEISDIKSGDAVVAIMAAARVNNR